MTTFTLTSPYLTDYTGLLVRDTPAPVQYYRHPHDLEILDYNLGDAGRRYMGPGYRAGKVRNRAVETGKAIPEVYTTENEHVTPLSDGWVNLVCEMNKPLPPEQARLIVTADDWGFNNSRETPGYDKPRACGGALLRGMVSDSSLWVDTLLTTDPVPPAEYVLSRRWLWYYGVMVNPKGQVTYMTLGMGGGIRVKIKVPLITRQPVHMPLAWLDKLPAGFDPSGYDQLGFG